MDLAGRLARFLSDEDEGFVGFLSCSQPTHTFVQVDCWENLVKMH